MGEQGAHERHAGALPARERGGVARTKAGQARLVQCLFHRRQALADLFGLPLQAFGSRAETAGMGIALGQVAAHLLHRTEQAAELVAVVVCTLGDLTDLRRHALTQDDGAHGRGARVHRDCDPRAGVGRFQAGGELALIVPVEGRAQLGQISHRRRALADGADHAAAGFVVERVAQVAAQHRVTHEAHRVGAAVVPQDGDDLWLAATTDPRSGPRTLNGAETGSRWRPESGHVGEPVRLRCLCVEPRLRISITQWKRPVCIP